MGMNIGCHTIDTYLIQIFNGVVCRPLPHGDGNPHAYGVADILRVAVDYRADVELVKNFKFFAVHQFGLVHCTGCVGEWNDRTEAVLAVNLQGNRVEIQLDAMVEDRLHGISGIALHNRGDGKVHPLHVDVMICRNHQFPEEGNIKCTLQEMCHPQGIILFRKVA